MTEAKAERRRHRAARVALAGAVVVLAGVGGWWLLREAAPADPVGAADSSRPAPPAEGGTLPAAPRVASDGDVGASGLGGASSGPGARSVSGRVVDPDGRPVAGALVVRRATAGEGARSSRQTRRSDAEGAFDFDPGEPGTVQAFHAGLAPSVPLAVAPGGAPLTLALRAGARVTARLVDARTGAPLAGAAALASCGGGEERSQPGTASGEVVLAALAPGRCDVRLVAPGYLGVARDGLALGDGRTVALGDVALAAGAFLVGEVRAREGGAPVAGARVRALVGGDAAAGPGPVAVTDGAGRFRLGPLSPASPVDALRLRVQKPGFEVVAVAVAAPGEAGGESTVAPIELVARPDVSPADSFGPAGPGLGLRGRRAGLMVSTVVPGSPAERAGIVPGSRLVAVAGYAAEDLPPREAMALLLGAAGTEVEVEVTGPAGDAPRRLRLARGAPVPSRGAPRALPE